MQDQATGKITFSPVPGIKDTLAKINKMKKTVWLCLVLISFNYSFSQVAAQAKSPVVLNFCASVESVSGYCNFNNTRFITQADSTSGKIFMEVKSTGTAPINATTLVFKIYKVNKAGDEKFETMLQQNIKPEWIYAWMPYNFDSPAKFDVKVYNESDQLICNRIFETIAFK
jgi:hypothetical protein